MRVRGFVNRTARFPRYFDGYSYQDKMESALSFDVPDGFNERRVLEEVFRQLNVDLPDGIGSLTPAQIVDYHQTFPSLSGGDVVAINERAFACSRNGWLSIDPSLIVEEIKEAVE